MKRKDIVISGAFYGTNFGDHLFALLLVQAVGPGSVIRDASLEIAKSAGVRSVSPVAIIRARALVMAPGGYFGEGDRESRVKKVIRWRQHYLAGTLARLSRTPYCIIGVGVGPIGDRLTRRLLKFVFEGAKRVTVRDDESARYLADYGVVLPRDFAVGADAALEWRRYVCSQSGPVMLGYARCGLRGRDRVFLHIEPNAGPDLSRVWSTVIESLAEFDDRLLVLGTDFVTEGADKYPVVAEARERLGPRVSVLEYEGPAGFIRDLSGVGAIVTHKLHAGVLGSALGKSVVSFSAHPKTSRFYRQIGEPDRCVPLSGLSRDEIREHFRKYSRLDVSLGSDVLVGARSHYESLAMFLNGVG